MTRENDGGGHNRMIVYYSNQTNLLGVVNGVKRWRNQLYLYNYCTGAWQSMYTHDYSHTPDGCQYEGACGWGPTVETHAPDPQPHGQGTRWSTGCATTRRR